MSHRVAWLVKFTYYGDANLDGSVNSTDQSMINAGAAAGLTGWTNGDFNYDGIINGSDYSLIDVMTNTIGQNANVPGGTITLAADADFPVSSLPTTTPTGEAIASWQADFGNGCSENISQAALVSMVTLQPRRCNLLTSCRLRRSVFCRSK